MSDRGTDDPRLAQQRPSDVGTQNPEEISARVNAAYASSAPIVPDEPEEKKPSGAERMAAALAAARGEGDRASQPAPAQPSPAPAPAAARKVRKAHLRISHVDPWSVMKTSFLLSVAIGIVMVVAVGVIWSVLGASGIWDSIDSTVGDVLGNESSAPFRVEDYLGMSRVMGFTMIVAVVDVVLITVIATLGAFLYNLAAVLLGGIEVTLAEDERVRG